MSSKLAWFAFYPAGWSGDGQLSMASFATKGIWMQVLCLAFRAPVVGKLTGTIDQLTRAIGCSRDETVTFIAEARQLGFATITDLDDDRIEIVSRRMQRDEEKRDSDRKGNAARQSRHRHAPNNGAVTPSVTVQSTTGHAGESESEIEIKNAALASPKRRRKSPEVTWPFGDSGTPPDWWTARAKELSLDPTKEWHAWRGAMVAHGTTYANWQQASMNRLDRRAESTVNGAAPKAMSMPTGSEYIARQA
jgi:hypothetical protein